LCPAYLPPRRIARVTSQIDLPPTIMGILGGGYRSPFFGDDVIHGDAADPFAIVIYNKRRYGIVSDRELMVFPYKGERIGFERNGAGNGWRQVTVSEAQARRAEHATAMLRVAEDLLVGGRYTAVKGTQVVAPEHDSTLLGQRREGTQP